MAQQHQVDPVLRGYDHAALSRKSVIPGKLKEPGHLLVHSPDRLHLPVLIHRSGYGDRLLHRHSADRGQRGEEFGAGCGIPFDPAVVLLECDRDRKCQGCLLREEPSEVAVKNQDPFGMDAAGKVRLALDVNDALHQNL